MDTGCGLAAGDSLEELVAALMKPGAVWYVKSVIEEAAAYVRSSPEDQARSDRRAAIRAELESDGTRLRAAKKAREVERLERMELAENRSTKIYRRVTENDAAVHGSRYLGLEGQFRWMPR